MSRGYLSNVGVVPVRMYPSRVQNRLGSHLIIAWIEMGVKNEVDAS